MSKKDRKVLKAILAELEHTNRVLDHHFQVPRVGIRDLIPSMRADKSSIYFSDENGTRPVPTNEGTLTASGRMAFPRPDKVKRDTSVGVQIQRAIDEHDWDLLDHLKARA